MKKEKARLDLVILEKGLFNSREKARAAIMAGRVLVNGYPVTKAGTLVSYETPIRIRGKNPPYVSRGGLKLARALEVFLVKLEGKIVLDIGASTGGFTDCALKNGAARVYAIDVGYGQLDWSLRHDSRVVVMERTNIRYLNPDQLGEKGDVATIDVSFISLNKVLPKVQELLKENGQVIALIKPQFEAGPEKVGKKGVVKDPVVHQEVVEKVLRQAGEQGFEVNGLTFSPIRGPKGNIEYLTWLKISTNNHEDQKLDLRIIQEVVHEAHNSLR